MKKKTENKGLLFILVISMILIGFWVYSNYFLNLETPVEEPETVIINSQKEQVVKEDISVGNKELKEKNIAVNYPSFGNQKVDDSIRRSIEMRVKDFKESLSEDRDDQSLEITYEIGEYYNEIKSVKYTYLYSGGARPATEIECQTYDLAKSERIFLSDIFKEGSDYLNKISGISYDYLIRSSDKESVKIGTVPREDNFSNFMLYSDRIVFYFSPCIVDACAAGPRQVPINLSDVNLFLKDNYVLKEGGGVNIVEIDGIKEGDLVNSPLQLEGRADGKIWVNNGGEIGRVELLDDSNNVIVGGSLKVSSEEDGVIRFKVSLVFDSPKTEKGYLVIHNEGMEKDGEKAVHKIIRVRFK